MEGAEVVAEGENPVNHAVTAALGKALGKKLSPYIEKNLKEYIDITAAFGRGYDDRFDISEITVKTLTDKLDKLIKIKRG